MKVYNKENYYNFYIEFNRIEEYNQYCKEWLKYYNIEIDIINKTNWTITDIPDVKNLNRIKQNINAILEALDEGNNTLGINTQVNQVWNVEKAQQLENSLWIYLDYLGNWQFQSNICGLATCGNDLRLGGVS